MCVIRPLNQWKASPTWPDPAAPLGLETWSGAPQSDYPCSPVVVGGGHPTPHFKVLFFIALNTGASLKASERRHPASTDYAVSISVSSGYRGSWTLDLELWLLLEGLEGLILRAPLRQPRSRLCRGLCLRLRLEPSPHSLMTLPTEPMKLW